MTETSPKNPREPRSRGRRILAWTFGLLGGGLVLLFIASFFLDEPIRSMTEKKANQALKGYRVSIPKLHLQLVGMSVTIKGLEIIQEAHPEPPVATVPMSRLTIHWREILSGKLVADLVLDRPRLHVNLQQLRSEAKSDTKFKDRGWQQAMEGAYPFKINRIGINGGEVTYIDEDPKRPLTLTGLNFVANNIRNIHLPDKTYPSEFHLDTAIFGSGRGRIDGRANFLAEPHMGARADFSVEKIPIEYFKPVLARSNLKIIGGVAGASGSAEYAPSIKKALVKSAELRDVDVEYIYSSAGAAGQKKQAVKAGKAVKKSSNEPGLLLAVEQLRLTGCTFGMSNTESAPAYRVFLSHTDMTLGNLSNQFVNGPAEARLTGRFMGNGPTEARARFLAAKSGPELDLSVKINDTRLASMNDMLRAYGNFDVTAGFFSLVSELHVKERRVTGYVKPFFRDLKVFDRRQDKEKNVFRKMYEALVGGVAGLLENRPREEVATKSEISGRLDKPQVSVMQTLVELVKNAFFKAILPTFEREVGKQGGKE